MSIREANASRVLQQGNTVADRTRSNQITLIDKEFSSNPSFREVIRNGTEVGVIITDNSSNATAKADNIRSIIMKPEDVLSVGDVFDFNNKKWICTSSEMFSDIYYRGAITQTNNTLTFYKTQILRTLPCIFTDVSIDLQENKFMNLPIGHYLVYIPAGYINKSDMNMRFIINGSVYKIEGISDATNGLIKIELTDDEITPDDNVELGIANYFSNQQPPTPSTEGLTVSLVPLNTTLMLGRTLELTAHAYNNGIEDLSKFYLFTVTNVDGTTNNYVTSSNVGNICTITANKASAYAGKCINVHVEILGNPSVFYNRQIKLIAL